MSDKPKVVTPFSTFYRVKVDETYVYYPEENWLENRAKFDAANVDRVEGYGVYDTRVSSSYAIGLFSTEQEANDTRLPSITGTEKIAEEIARYDEQDSNRLTDGNFENEEDVPLERDLSGDTGEAPKPKDSSGKPAPGGIKSRRGGN